MEFREFLEKAFEEVELYQDVNSLYSNVSKKRLKSLSDEELESLFFQRSWVSGGSTGGSCYGQSDRRSVDADMPEDITQHVAKVLMAVGKEDLSFVRYMATIQPLIKNAELSGSGDYYGNYYDHARVYVNLKELYDVLYGNDE
jgi:hypothetical protein